MDEEMKITLILKKTDSGYTSTRHIVGIDPVTAGIILIDVGRDVLAQIAARGLTHEREHEENDLQHVDKTLWEEPYGH